MWKSQAGHSVNVQQNQDDDDWETDPDFVVRHECRLCLLVQSLFIPSLINSIFYEFVHCLLHARYSVLLITMDTISRSQYFVFFACSVSCGAYV